MKIPNPKNLLYFIITNEVAWIIFNVVMFAVQVALAMIPGVAAWANWMAAGFILGSWLSTHRARVQIRKVSEASTSAMDELARDVAKQTAEQVGAQVVNHVIHILETEDDDPDEKEARIRKICAAFGGEPMPLSGARH